MGTWPKSNTTVKFQKRAESAELKPEVCHRMGMNGSKRTVRVNRNRVGPEVGRSVPVRAHFGPTSGPLRQPCQAVGSSTADPQYSI